jgi:HAD superfamily hydrolase (TIGR01509 family)
MIRRTTVFSDPRLDCTMRYFYFDLGNVLVHFDSMIACRNVGRLVDRDERQVFQALYGSGLEVRYEHGELSDEQFADLFRAELGVACGTDDLLREMSAMFTPNRAIEPIIRRLQNNGVPLGILSNTCAAHWRWVTSQGWSVANNWYRDAVLSFEVGVMKPEKQIYTHATQVAGVPPESIFFVDDRAENIEGARAAGWRAELFVDAERLMEVLFEQSGTE